MKPRRKTAFLALIVLCGILLFGCGQEEAVETEAPEGALSAGAEGELDFKLPEGFALEQQEAGGYALLQNGQVVGGLAQNDLMKTDLVAYLESYVQPPLVMEYIYGSGKDNVWTEVDLIAYDPETETAHEVSHYLFEKDGKMYDLFLDNALMEWETEKRILETSGLYLPEE